MMRGILERAGAHLYGSGRDVFYAGRGLLGMHSGDGGRRLLTLRDGLRVEVDLEPSSTAVFDSRTGERLL
jgi:hypothetical protein